MPDRLTNMSFEEMRPLLAAYLTSAANTFASHAEKLDVLKEFTVASANTDASHATRLKETTDAIKVHDADLEACRVKLLELSEVVHRQQEFIKLLYAMAMRMWRHLGLPEPQEGEVPPEIVN